MAELKFEKEPGVEYIIKKEVFRGEELDAIYRVARKPERELTRLKP